MTLSLLLVVCAAGAEGYPAAREALLASGCAASSCHGSTLVPMPLRDQELSPAELEKEAALVRARTNAQAPDKSLLLTKALGHDHLGGKNLEASSCAVKRLLAFAKHEVESCSELPTRAAPHGMTGALPEPLDVLMRTCATSGCHGGAAAPRLEAKAEAASREANARALRPFGSAYGPTRSALFRALMGQKQHAVVLHSPEEPAFRALFGWMTDEAPPQLKVTPSFTQFQQRVQPLLVKRGCTESTCHGAVGTTLLLFGNEEGAMDSYVRLLGRAVDGSLLSKTRNVQAHGGGLNLGDASDCVAVQLEAWLKRTTPKPCRARPQPNFEAFRDVVQPGLEQVGCTKCHARGVGGFMLANATDDAQLRANYAATLKFIDVDYPPVSHVLARVRDACTQTRILAWVGSKPIPTCTPSLDGGTP